MAVDSDGSPKPVKVRMAYGSSTRKRRSSKARSSISGTSWDQNSLPLSLRQASFNSTARRPTAAQARHNQKVRLNRPCFEPRISRVMLARDQGAEQLRPFDAFVDVPSPFAKGKTLAKDHGYPDHQKDEKSFTNTSNSILQPNHTSPPPSPPYTFKSPTDTMPDANVNSNTRSQRVEGYLDARTRATNVQHTRPEWMTWDFVDLFLTDLPPQIRTVDLWNNFKKEGEVDLIDVFVTRGGQKDTKARLRFRPPPKRDFFTSPSRYILILGDGRTSPVYVQLDKTQKKTFTKPSPVNENVTYPETTELGAESIDFGVLVGPSNMLIKRTRRSTPRGRVKMVLNLGRREIDIRFPSIYSNKIREYKFVIPIDQVFDLSQSHAQNDIKTSFILTLRTPPHFYKKLSEGISATHDDAALTWREEDSWLRQTNILSEKHEVAQLKSRPVTLKNYPEGIVNIGRWTTYRITVDDSTIDREKYRIFRAALKDYNVPITKVENFQISDQGHPAWDLLDDSVSEHESILPSLSAQGGLEHSLYGLLNSKNNETYLPFPVRYQLDVCISNGWINEHNLSREFLETLSGTENERAKHILECVALNKLRIFDPMEIFNLRVRKLPSMKSRIPENCVLIRSVIITPSTMMLNTPYVEMTNRVIRRYRVHSDRFLRVRFEDDEQRGYARINATSQKTMDEVLSKVFRTLTCGIVIGDRHYDFLAFGNSQLREHGAYFFAPLPSGPTASHIRAWMGRFDHERIVAKHAARIGQCFSTTRAIRNAGFPPIRKKDLIDDVERNGFNFTDGVGKISRFYAETIAKELGLRGTPPSVYQFRMAGCKGVLAVAPELGATHVKIRHSQFKFETTYSGMEVIRWSEYWVATLNRQLILVLSDLGVPDDIFLLIQEKEIQLMERAMINDSAAMEALTGHVDPNKMTLTIAGLVQAGFRRSNEPFVTSLLGLWRAWSIKYLKEKARLSIRDGACVLGCTDESGTLRGHFDADQGHKDCEPAMKVARLPEVFIQITSPDTGHRKVIQGLCVIARNPSLHPGDMRVVKAIDVAALHHLVDVLVLPQTGDRDVSSMCSGGDLDGDDYVVIWDERLLPKIWNAEPMDFTPPPPKSLNRDVTQLDITQFFVQYMKNDFLPKIALAHLAWADFLDEGIRHGKCLDLARLHSKAVDYPKSGQAARMPKALNAKQWPHFMEKKGRNTYRSHKVLGQLYDAVDRVAFVPNYDAPFDERILNACEPEEDVMQDARELKHEYDTSLQRVMAQHDIKTEFEVWSTFVLDHSKASKDYKFHEEIGQLSNSLKEQYYNAVVDKAGGKNWTQLVPWAVAMYRVTKAELESAKLQGRGATMPFISFPWLLRTTLTEIVKGVDSSADKKVAQDSGDILRSIQGPSFNTESQMYNDPYQPGKNESTEDVLSDPSKAEVLAAKEQASPSEVVTIVPSSGLAIPTSVLSDAHHNSNEETPFKSYALGVRIPPQPTAEQYAIIEQMIDGSRSPDSSLNTSPNSSGVLEESLNKFSPIEEHTDDLAENSLMNLSWPAIKPNSSMPASLDVSEENDSSNSEDLAGDALAVKEHWAVLAIDKPAKTSEQNSTIDSDVLIDPQQANIQDDQNGPTKRSMSSSLCEDLAGLQLQSTPSPAPRAEKFHHYVSEDRRRSSRSIALDKDDKASRSPVNAPIGHSDVTSKKRKGSGQRSASLLANQGFGFPTTKNTIENMAGHQRTRIKSHDLMDANSEGTGSKRNEEEEDDDDDDDDNDDEVLLDPLASTYGGGSSGGNSGNDIDRLIKLNGS